MNKYVWLLFRFDEVEGVFSEDELTRIDLSSWSTAEEGNEICEYYQKINGGNWSLLRYQIDSPAITAFKIFQPQK